MHFRWACNKRFRKAMTTFADNSRHASPWAAKIYSDARASGKDHPHAVRVLARAWIRVIWPCWLNHTPYDPARHGAAAALTPPIAHEVDTGGRHGPYWSWPPRLRWPCGPDGSGSGR